MRFKIYNKWVQPRTTLSWPRTTLSRLLSHDFTTVSIVATGFEMSVPDSVIAKLSQREQQVLYLRYVLLKTRQQIGDELNVTRERARQIEGKSLRKILGMLEGIKNDNRVADRTESTDNN